jgi:TolB-like protein
MASLIPGYEYDIFISYRQKDNKYDGWVTEFVDNLKRELEATFKEEVSVYFDINPHDGLLETHDVDASLKEKLKCLVFIPIISRTYCDPKSFAWEHEFVAFMDQASKDQFGLKVKLPNGNVANRVLPVRIHDLDAADIKLCESVLGGVLRGVEFIYKEPGVNKPLTSEDDEKKNLNKTKYRIQINKIANAIKEIISGLMAGEVVSGKEKTEPKLPWEEVRKREKIIPEEKRPGFKKSKLLSYIISIVFVLVLLGVYVYPIIFKRGTLEKLKSSGEKISIAVMPFQNMTNDTTLNIWQEGIQGDLITSLSNIQELKVRHQESIKTLLQPQVARGYASISPEIAGSVSRKLDADIFIYGSIKRAGDLLRIDAQLIDTKTRDILKSFELNRSYNQEIIFEITDSLRKNITDFLLMSKLIKENPFLHQLLSLPKSSEALRYFLYGVSAWDKGNPAEAKEWFLKILAVDSSYNLAAFNIENIYSSEGNHAQQIKWILRNYNRRDQMPFTERVYAEFTYACNFEPPSEQIKYLKQLQDQDDQFPSWPYLLGNIYISLNQYDKAVVEYEKCLNINRKWGKLYLETNPVYISLGNAYHKTGQYKKERKLYKESDKYNQDMLWMINRHAVLELSEKDSVAAYRYIERFKVVMKVNSSSDADIASEIAGIYLAAGIMNKAEEYFREAVRLEPKKPLRMNSLAWFLINNDRNVDEGLELVETALKIEPDNWGFMGTKGWGLYKLGKYSEALEVLEKSIELNKPYYNYDNYQHVDEVKKAMASQK